MKAAILILSIVGCSLCVSSQTYVPCLIDVAPPGFNATMRVNMPGADRTPIRVHQPQWKLRPESSAIFGIKAGTVQSVLILMPAAGTCSGSFEAADNRDDLTRTATDAAGRYIHTKPTVSGDVEIFVVDENGWRAFAANQNYTMYGSTGRKVAGDFSFDLPAGYFRFVINNRYSTFASKWVRLTIGSGPPPRVDNSLPGVTITPDRP